MTPNFTEKEALCLKLLKEGKTLGEIQLQYLNLPNAEEIFKKMIEDNCVIYCRCIPEILKFPSGKALFQAYLENDENVIGDPQAINDTLNTIFSLPDAEDFLEIYFTHEGYLPPEYETKLLALPNVKKLVNLYQHPLSDDFRQQFAKL